MSDTIPVNPANAQATAISEALAELNEPVNMGTAAGQPKPAVAIIGGKSTGKWLLLAAIAFGVYWFYFRKK